MARSSTGDQEWSEVISGSGRRGRYRLVPASGTKRANDAGRDRGPLESAPRMRIYRERRRRRVKMALMAAAAVVVVLALGAAVWAYTFVLGVEKTMHRGANADPRVEAALTEVEATEPFTVLLMGVDRRPKEKYSRTDTMLLARVDPKTKKVTMVSIPRDTKVEVPGYGTEKINSAYYHGGPALAVETVEGFLDVPINHYMAVNFDGFKSVVDAMGGIYIDVDVEIDDWKAASGTPNHRAKHIDAGYQLLDGEHALTYVRSRDLPDADFGRMRHQQTFFKALARQSVRFSNWYRLPGVVKEFAKHTTTDMTVGEMLGVLRAMRGITDQNLQTATLAGEWRSPYVHTDPKVKAALANALRTGADIEATRSAEATLAPSSVSVTVRNGAGVGGVAADAAAKLKKAGFKVGEVGNANQFVYDETLVVYEDDSRLAEAVVDALGRGKVVQSRGMYSFGTDVLVVVGKDWELGG